MIINIIVIEMYILSRFKITLFLLTKISAKTIQQYLGHLTYNFLYICTYII